MSAFTDFVSGGGGRMTVRDFDLWRNSATAIYSAQDQASYDGSVPGFFSPFSTMADAVVALGGSMPAVDGWRTMVEVSGSSGRLESIVLPMSSTTINDVFIEVTIDGKKHLFDVGQISPAARVALGVVVTFLSSALPTSDFATTPLESGNDVSLLGGTRLKYHGLLAPRFEKSLKVRFTEYPISSDSAKATGACAIVLD